MIGPHARIVDSSRSDEWTSSRHLPPLIRYSGSLKEASFHSIKTTRDGSVGIKASKPLGTPAVCHAWRPPAVRA